MNDQKKHYNDLMDGNSRPTFFTKETRYNVEGLLRKKNIFDHFDQYVKNHISPDDKILDYGCGPGTFSIKMSKMTKNIVCGVDISENFINECGRLKKKLNLKNFMPSAISPGSLPFKDNTFDKILLFHVIHHLEDIEKNFKEINRVLKKNGKIIIYEPNKLNPLIALIHLIDPVERGLLSLGTKKKYIKIFNKFNLHCIDFRFSGIIVGPNSKILNIISLILNIKYMSKLFGWLNPNLILVAKK